MQALRKMWGSAYGSTMGTMMMSNTVAQSTYFGGSGTVQVRLLLSLEPYVLGVTEPNRHTTRRPVPWSKILGFVGVLPS